MVIRAGKTVEEYERQDNILFTLSADCEETGEHREYIGTHEGIDLILHLFRRDVRTWNWEIDYLKKDKIIYRVAV